MKKVETIETRNSSTFISHYLTIVNRKVGGEKILCRNTLMILYIRVSAESKNKKFVYAIVSGICVDSIVGNTIQVNRLLDEVRVHVFVCERQDI